jgi:hypothetical protein
VIPPIYQFGLLCLVAYRAWRLIAEDDILNRPRRWLLRLPQNWAEGDPRPKKYRNEWALFLTCPWCAGAWVSLITYIGWILTIGDTPDSVSDVFVGIGIWFAISCVVGLIRSKLDPPE